MSGTRSKKKVLGTVQVFIKQENNTITHMLGLVSQEQKKGRTTLGTSKKEQLRTIKWNYNRNIDYSASSGKANKHKYKNEII